MNWEWLPLLEPTGYRAAAVYAVRLIDRRAVVSISRFLGVDREGLLTIGMTTNLEYRRRRFIAGSTVGRGHSAGNILFFLKSVEVFQRSFRNANYEIAFFAVTTGQEARRLESQITRDYWARFGEGPPLTSMIPDRYAHLQDS